MAKLNGRPMRGELVRHMRDFDALSTQRKAEIAPFIRDLLGFDRAYLYGASVVNPGARNFLSKLGYSLDEKALLDEACWAADEILALPGNKEFIDDILKRVGPDHLLHIAFNNRHGYWTRCCLDLAVFALENGADPSKSHSWHLGRNPAAAAVMMPYAVEQIRGGTIPVNARSFDGSPLLHHAADIQDASAIRDLLGLGADPFMETWGGSNPEERSIIGHTLLRSWNLRDEVIDAFGTKGLKFAERHGMLVGRPQLQEKLNQLVQGNDSVPSRMKG